MIAAGAALVGLSFLAIRVYAEGPPYPVTNTQWFSLDPEWTKHLLVILIAVTAVLLPLVWLFWARIEDFLNRLVELFARRPRLLLTTLSAVFLPLLIFFALFVLQDFPNSVDEYAYIFQAKIFSHGRLWNVPHPAHDHFAMSHIATQDGKWVMKFPPGWSLALTPAIWLGIPLWLVNPLLAVASLWVFFYLARRLYGAQTAVIAVLIFAFSSFFIFNSASYFAHTLCALLVLLAVYYGIRYLDGERPGHALWAGFFIGFAFLTRYYTAVLVALPFLVHLISRQGRDSLKGIVWLTLGALPWLVVGMYYNYAITGHPLKPPFLWYVHPQNIDMDLLAINLRTITLNVRYLARFVIWTAPPLLFLFGWFVSRSLGKRREVDFIDFMLPVMVFGYLFYGAYAGNQYGPRYYYEVYPFVILAVVRRLVDSDGFGLSAAVRKAALAVLVAGFITANLATLIHARAEHRVIFERNDLYRLVEQKKIRNAIVFVASSTGVTRFMPVLDLTRNGTELTGDVLYALDKGEANRKLVEYFPGRKYYRYLREKDDPNGRLVEISLE